MMAVMSGALPWSKGTLLTRRCKNKSKAAWPAHPLGLCLLPALFKNVVLTLHRDGRFGTAQPLLSSRLLLFRQPLQGLVAKEATPH